MPSSVTDEIRKIKEAYEGRVRSLSASVEKRDAALAVLARVAARIHGEQDVPTILDIALEEILDKTGAPAGWVFMGNQKDKKLHLAASRGVAGSYLEEVAKNGLSECLCPEVFWSGHRMQARNTTECPRMPSIVDGAVASTAHACIPLVFDGESRGVLNVAAQPGAQFADDDLRLLDTLGHQVCMAIERAGHLKAERLRNQEARAMAAINKAIGGALDADAVLRAVGETAREIVGADRVHVLLGSDPRAMTVAHLSGLPHPALRERQSLDLAALDSTTQQAAIEERKTFTINDWEHDARVNRSLAKSWGVGSGIVTPLLARDQILGILAITRVAKHRWTEEQVDVAEALAAQASVALENARLYESARQAYQDLKAAQQRILQNEKMAVLGTFASGLAHEVRNPLNSIALQLSLLERRVARAGPELEAALRGLLGVIREEIKRLDALVGDFLLFSRTNRIQYRPASLDAIADEVMRLLRPEARERGVTLRRQAIGAPIPNLQMDDEKMKQVLINLVQNAIEAMPRGGAVTVESGVEDGQARIVVRDDGPGLPDGLDIFQLFVTTKPKGTGLGLSIAQQIVLEHGGEIAATSQAGRGAIFTVSLPLTPVSTATEESYEH